MTQEPCLLVPGYLSKWRLRGVKRPNKEATESSHRRAPVLAGRGSLSLFLKTARWRASDRKRRSGTKKMPRLAWGGAGAHSQGWWSVGLDRRSQPTHAGLQGPYMDANWQFCALHD